MGFMCLFSMHTICYIYISVCVLYLRLDKTKKQNQQSNKSKRHSLKKISVQQWDERKRMDVNQAKSWMTRQADQKNEKKSSKSVQKWHGNKKDQCEKQQRGQKEQCPYTMRLLSFFFWFNLQPDFLQWMKKHWQWNSGDTDIAWIVVAWGIFERSDMRSTTSSRS